MPAPGSPLGARARLRSPGLADEPSLHAAHDSECPTPRDLYITNAPAAAPVAFARDRGVFSPKRKVGAALAAHDGATEDGGGDAAASTPSHRDGAVARGRIADNSASGAIGGEEDKGGAAAAGRQGSRRGGARRKSIGGDILNLGGEKFPTYAELQLLPDEIQTTLLSLVMDYLRRMVYPRAIFLARKRQKKQLVHAAQHQVPPVTAAFVQSIPLFSRWTNIDSLIRSLELQLFERDELVVCEGECAQSGVLFLAQGTLQARKLKPAITRKGFGVQNTSPSGTLEPMSVYDPMIFLTEKPRTESLRALTRCAIWVLKRDAFFAHLNQLPEDRRREALGYAMEVRREVFPTMFPLTGLKLQRVPLLARVPLSSLDALAPRCEPRVVAAGETICRIGEGAAEMWFIARGTVELYAPSTHLGHDSGGDSSGRSTARKQQRRRSVVAGGGGGEQNLVLQTRAGPGQIVGDMAVLFSQKRNVTLVAATTVDMYAITRDTLTAAINNNTAMGEILQGAHKLQAEWQRQAKTRYLAFISAIPFIKDLGSPPLFARLLAAFQSRVHPVHTTILSVSECCESVIIITRGRARCTATNVELCLGEALGFTLLVPHRWTYHVTAQETVESIELPYTEYRAILREFGLFERVKELSLGLIYPRVYPEHFQHAIEMVRHCRNPPCFPTSSDAEPRPFGARVQAQLPVPLPIRRQRTETGVFVGSQLPRALAPLYNQQQSGAGGGSGSGGSGSAGGGGGGGSSSTAMTAAQRFIEAVHRQERDIELMYTAPSSAPAGNDGGAAAATGDGSPTPARSASSLLHHTPAALAKRQRAQEQREHMSRLADAGRGSSNSSSSTQQKRAAADIERLSKRILELQLSVYSSAGSSPSPDRQRTRSLSHSTPGRQHHLAPLQHSPSGADTPKSTPNAVKAPPKTTTRTIASQTTKSFLRARAKLLCEMTGDPDCGGGGGGGGGGNKSAAAAPASAPDSQEATGGEQSDCKVASRPRSPAPAPGQRLQLELLQLAFDEAEEEAAPAAAAAAAQDEERAATTAVLTVMAALLAGPSAESETGLEVGDHDDVGCIVQLGRVNTREIAAPAEHEPEEEEGMPAAGAGPAGGGEQQRRPPSMFIVDDRSGAQDECAAKESDGLPAMREAPWRQRVIVFEVGQGSGGGESSTVLRGMTAVPECPVLGAEVVVPLAPGNKANDASATGHRHITAGATLTIRWSLISGCDISGSNSNPSTTPR